MLGGVGGRGRGGRSWGRGTWAQAGGGRRRRWGGGGRLVAVEGEGGEIDGWQRAGGGPAAWELRCWRRDVAPEVGGTCGWCGRRRSGEERERMRVRKRKGEKKRKRKREGERREGEKERKKGVEGRIRKKEKEGEGGCKEQGGRRKRAREGIWVLEVRWAWAGLGYSLARSNLFFFCKKKIILTINF